MPHTNTLAYLASSSVTKEKSFITLPPGLERKTDGDVSLDGDAKRQVRTGGDVVKIFLDVSDGNGDKEERHSA